MCFENIQRGLCEVWLCKQNIIKLCKAVFPFFLVTYHTPLISYFMSSASLFLEKGMRTPGDSGGRGTVRSTVVCKWHQQAAASLSRGHPERNFKAHQPGDNLTAYKMLTFKGKQLLLVCPCEWHVNMCYQPHTAGKVNPCAKNNLISPSHWSTQAV